MSMVTGFEATARYSWGDPNNPTAEDPQSDDLEKAEESASSASESSAWGHCPIIALWDNQTGDILALYFDGQGFRP